MIILDTSPTMNWWMFGLTALSYVGAFSTVFFPNLTQEVKQADPTHVTPVSDSLLVLKAVRNSWQFNLFVRDLRALIVVVNLIFLAIRGWNWSIFFLVFVVNNLSWGLILNCLIWTNNFRYLDWPDWIFWLMHFIGLLVVLGIAYAASFRGHYLLSAWLVPSSQPSNNS